jgi:hypothetical protein
MDHTSPDLSADGVAVMSLTKKRAEKIQYGVIEVAASRARSISPKALDLVKQLTPERVNDEFVDGYMTTGIPGRLGRLLEFVISELDDIEAEMVRRGWLV